MTDTSRLPISRSPITVSLYGAGRLSQNVAKVLERRDDSEVCGPFDRARRADALSSGVDVAVIATRSLLHEVALDIELAVRSASNVIVSAEEAAFPWVANAAVADELDSLAKRNGVTILGAGLNPGFSFDALVLTAAGTAQSVTSIRVDRVIDLSMFQESALAHLGVGFSEAEFDTGVKTDAIRGHIGFAESMSIVATRLGVELEGIDLGLSPILARRSYQCEHGVISHGQSAGICHRATGVANGRAWYDATFTAHIDLPSIDKAPLDEIVISGDPPGHLAIDPGVSSQMGAAAMIANSIRRVKAAPPGWLTVGDLPPAIPG